MTLSQALLQFQKDAPALQRDSINPHFKSKFISLEHLLSEIVPKLNAHGLVVSQFPTTVDGNGGGLRPALRTRITHAESGEFLEDVMLLMPPKDDPQGQGSAITYARRYSLMAALGLVADEDDDANRASNVGAGRRAGTDGGSSQPSPVSDNPAAQAQERVGAIREEEFQAAAAHAQRPGALPSEQVIHFGKNRGVLLGALTPAQLKWYAQDWKVQDDPSDYDKRLKAAAVALHGEWDHPDFDVPF